MMSLLSVQHALLILQSVLVGLAALVVALVLEDYYRKSRDRLPPGPKGFPILGNLPQIPAESPGHQMKKWAEEHGEMMTLRMGRRNFIFLNSSRVIQDILIKRAGQTSGRPRQPLAMDLLSGGNRIVLMQYGERWRKLRKIMHSMLSITAVQKWASYQDVESRQMLYYYLHNPDGYFKHNGFYANSVIMSVVFGRRAVRDDPLGDELFLSIERFITHEVNPQLSLINFFPGLMDIVPPFLQWWRPWAVEEYERTLDIYQRLFDDLAARKRKGMNVNCFSDRWLEEAAAYNFTKEQELFVSGSLVEGASDTTRLSINRLISCAAACKDWVPKARKELDAVCGDAERLPTFEDSPNLPYVNAVLKEVLRFRPKGNALGMAHEVTDDFEYEGYFFKKGTVVSINLWSIANDEKEYKDARRFNPDRYLDDDVFDHVKGHWSFGAGRRICSGTNVASRNLFLAFARLIYLFDFDEIPGKPIDLDNVDVLQHNQAPFPVKITPRSAKHAAFIERECKSAVNEL